MAADSRRVIIAALIGNSLIAVTKFAAATITGSSAMLSEGIHSLVDTGNQVLLLYGLRRAKRPADERFPFGHGKEVYFWGFAVAILIFAVGAGVSLYEGVLHLMHPEPITRPAVNYVVLGLSMVFEGVAWTFAFRAFRKVKGAAGYVEAVQQSKDPTMFIVLFEDSAAMLGLAVAFLGVLLTQVTGVAHFDGAASVVIGFILGGTAAWLAYETKGLLIGESARPDVVEGVRRLARESRAILHVNEVLTMHVGPEFILVNLSVEFADEAAADEIEEAVAHLDAAIKRRYARVKRVFVEAEARSRRREGPVNRRP